MKKLTCFIVLLIFPTLVSSQRRDERNLPKWELVASTNSQLMYRSINRITYTPHGTIISWEKFVPKLDTVEGRADRAKTIETISKSIGSKLASSYIYYTKIEEYDCKQSKKRTLQFLFYNDSGAVIHRVPSQIPETKRPEWFNPRTGTVGKAIINAVCSAGSNSLSDRKSSEWINFKSAEGKFSVSMPSRPIQNKSATDSFVGPIIIHRFIADSRNEIYMVLYTDYPPSFMDGSPLNNILNAARDSTIATIDNMELVSERTIELDGNIGREFVGQISNKAYAVYRAFWIRPRIYNIVAIRMDGTTLSVNGRRFLDSFRLNDE